MHRERDSCWIVGLVLVLAACGPGAVGELGSEGSSSTAGTAETTSETSASATGETASETSASATTNDNGTGTGTETETGTETATTGEPPEPGCGNGIVEDDEICDDGNTLGNDWCSADCQTPLIPCGNAIYECGDTLDNDEDGLVDLYDPECLSPCDDAEDEFWRGLPGQSNDCPRDCEWDSNMGQGDDHCRYDLRCDPLDPGGAAGCAYDPLLAACDDMEQAQHPECVPNCGPMTPNGCDCFGCCEIDGVARYVGEPSMCTLDTLDDCPCTINMACFNPWEPEACELQLFETYADLPPGCDAPSCAEGSEACDHPYACPEGQVCLAGCCLDYSLQ